MYCLMNFNCYYVFRIGKLPAFWREIEYKILFAIESNMCEINKIIEKKKTYLHILLKYSCI